MTNPPLKPMSETLPARECSVLRVIEPDKKSFWKSKTLWVQVVAMASLLFPAVQEFVGNNPESVLAALGAVNVLLRFATSGRVFIFPPNDGEDFPPDGDGSAKSGGSRWMPPVVCCCMGTAVALMGGLPS